MVKIGIRRFGCPYNPKKELRERKKTKRHILISLLVFSILALVLTIVIFMVIKKYVACLAINETIDSMWIGSVASYLGGTIGGIISGAFAFLGVFFTIRYYRESDDQKEKASIQPFLLITTTEGTHPVRGFALGNNSEEEKILSEKIEVKIKNIGNGFATILTLRNGFIFGGIAYNKVIPVNESVTTFFMVDPISLESGIEFQLQYIDAKRNEYIQNYTIVRKKNSIVEIESGYPMFLDQY